MLPVTGHQQFLNQFEMVKDSSRLFAFILFDSRPSHKAVEIFVDTHFDWLDSLAASANMFGFAFLHRDKDAGLVRNPSLKVAASFGIQPNELPGVVAFTMLPNSQSVSEAVFLPIRAKLFTEEQNVVEEVFADLFSVFQGALRSTKTEEELIEKLKEDFGSIKRKEQRRPIVGFLGERMRSLATLPDKLLEAMATAFGEAIATRIMDLDSYYNFSLNKHAAKRQCAREITDINAPTFRHISDFPSF